MPSRHIAGLLASLLIAIAAPATATAAVTPKAADGEAALLSQFDQVNQAAGTIGLADGGYGDGHAVNASYSGGGQNGYARGIFNVDWRESDDVWYSAAFYIPEGFKAAMQGQVAIMRWDDYGAHPEAAGQGGVVINGGDRRARVVLNQMPAATQVQLTDSFDLPEGRWFHLEVHQTLRTGSAVNEVFLDGTRVVSSTAPNISAGRGANRIRYGLVAISGGAQTNPLSLRFDHARVSTTRVGPDPALTNPVDTPPPATSTPPPPPPSTPPPPPPPAPTTTTITPPPTPSPPSARKPKKSSSKVTGARYTRRVRKCVNGVLTRAKRRGDVTRLEVAVRRCVTKYGRRAA